MSAKVGETIEGVILAAGKGTRMRHLGMHMPKPLLPICNRPVIRHQIDLMQSVGINDITIVIGHLGHQIVRELSVRPPPGANLKFVEQVDMLGIAHALGQLEQRLFNPFLVFLGDCVFTASRLENMLTAYRSGTVGAVLSVKEEPDVDAIRRNFSVELDGDGFVARVLEKPRIVPNNLKGCGAYLFEPTVFDAIRRTPRTAARDEYEITHSIQLLIDFGVKVGVSPVIDWDMNLTVPCDLLASNLRWKAGLGQDNVIGEGCSIAAGAEIVNSVICDGAEIRYPVRVQDSLLLPASKLGVREAVTSVVVVGDDVLQC